jgi:hypothetical protein
MGLGFSMGLVGRRVKHKGLDGVEFRCVHVGEDSMLVSECETTDTGESSGVVQVTSLCTQKFDLVGSTGSPSGKLCVKVSKAMPDLVERNERRANGVSGVRK